VGAYIVSKVDSIDSNTSTTESTRDWWKIEGNVAKKLSGLDNKYNSTIIINILDNNINISI
jgi:hypothetical protein